MAAKKSRKCYTQVGIVACGWVENLSRHSIKYKRFEKEGKEWALLLGHGGALRKTQGAIAESYSITDTKVHEAFAYVGHLIVHGHITGEDRVQNLRAFVDFTRGAVTK